MVCTVLGHVTLQNVPPEGAAFYADGLGAKVATGDEVPDDGCVRINVGDHQLVLAGGSREGAGSSWCGHIEFWTREPLDALQARVAPLLDEDSLTRHDDTPDDRLVINCPYGNLLIIRPAPATAEVRGAPPGGYGSLVSISRVVCKVRCGTTAAIRAFWITVLGSRAEHHTVAGGRVSYCSAPFGSGQQLIFEERRDEDGNDVMAPLSLINVESEAVTENATNGSPLRTTLSAASPEAAPLGLASAQRITMYLQSREAFRVAFMAAAAKKLLDPGSLDWSEVEERVEFGVQPALDAAGLARLGDLQCMMSAIFGTDPDKPKELQERFSINLGKKYGEGGYGATYSAADKSTGEQLAVKILDMRKVRIETIQKEAHILETLQNPNVISVRGHGAGYGGKHKDHYFIFMELASGGELFDQVIDRGADAMPEPYARGFFCQMLDGVNYCHIAGVAHRDLKLENVLLNAEGKLKLIDFGLSHVYPVNRSTGFVDRSKPLRDVCGSKSYAAPEVLAAKGYDGFAADMWSLGVCLFAMLSGFFPLDEATEQDWRFPRLHVAQSHGASTVHTVYGFYSRTARHLSREVVDLLDGLLRIDPSRRMTMAQCREHPWVTGKPLEISLDQGSYNPHQMIDGEDGPVYRGMGAVPSTWEDGAAPMDDDMPVYRSLGGVMGAPVEGATLPGLTRQKGHGAPSFWGSLDCDDIELS